MPLLLVVADVLIVDVVAPLVVVLVVAPPPTLVPVPDELGDMVLAVLVLVGCPLLVVDSVPDPPLPRSNT